MTPLAPEVLRLTAREREELLAEVWETISQKRRRAWLAALPAEEREALKDGTLRREVDKVVGDACEALEQALDALRCL